MLGNSYKRDGENIKQKKQISFKESPMESDFENS